MAPYAEIVTTALALMGAGLLIKFRILQTTASSEPALPDGSAELNAILSSAEAVSCTTESAVRALVGRSTWQSAVSCGDAENRRPDAVMDVMG